MPDPYKSDAINPKLPSINASRRLTSSRESTVGTRCGRLARTIVSIHGNSIDKTSRYRNNKADSAWFWVPAATCPWVASVLRKPSTSATSMSRGCRLSFAKMKRRIQPTYACSVRRL
jgi:hypothetical protein